MDTFATSGASRVRSGPRIALVAGEASGDQLGASLIAALHARFPNAEFAGVGGDRMRESGLDQWSHYAPLAVMGLAEVVSHLPRLLRFRRDVVQRLLVWRPDVFIGIDAPDFNLGVEERLKAAGIPTVHYVSPSVWAWREKRAAKIGAAADRVLCLFPMEPPIYAAHGVDARFVGHPLADTFPDRPDRATARNALAVLPDVPVLSVLPGSRLSEIRRLGPAFLETAERLMRERPGLRVLVPAANTQCREAIDSLLAARPMANTHLRVIDGRAHDALVAADVVLIASGTAALETLLAKRPMVVGYRIAALTYLIVRLFGLLKIDRYSLPNILAGRELVPEFMQGACHADALTPAVARLLDSADARAEQLAGFDAIHAALRAPGGASHSAAVAVAGLIDPSV